MKPDEKPKVREEFIKNIQGKDFVLYAGLLDLAHQKGLQRLDVEILQFPSIENDNTCICKATATTTESGQLFSDIGDANAQNTGRMIAPHYIRMASTRAKARVLRDLCNIGDLCALEELGEPDDSYKPSKLPTPYQNNGVVTLSEAQKRAIYSLMKRRGMNEEQLNQLIQELFQSDLEQLSSRDASQLIQTLQKSA